MRRFLFGVAVLGALSCASDRDLVKESLASHHDHAGRFMQACCAQLVKHTDDPNETPVCMKLVESDACKTYGKAIDKQLDRLVIANGAQKLGPLPSSARKDLRAANSAVEKAAKAVEP